ncbi:MAG: Mrp/NBP35 family ATP-binding protein [Armatimonadota bacterium]|nr:Mrp/NBP35 family ATP-binding protein [Armatimonadota bacterium]MCX7777852.1 Mrp/NBP35 family ATP-binding protein [Armatimonadota bacterium]MDW8025844.1 Mrp/NBP35 family ATP-binding protein [Armatimonadota bacterium]
MQDEVNKEAVIKALRSVIDPELRRDIVSAGMVKDVQVDGGVVKFTLELTTPACPLRDYLVTAARQAVERLDGVKQVEVNVSARVPQQARKRELIPLVKNVIAIGSGKGGVGKTTVTVNVSVALSQMGARVGLLDGDIYGPNVPKMIGVYGQPKFVSGKILPLSAWGLKVMSIGFFIEQDVPVIWRGPMLHRAVEQLLGDVDWGELDYLFVDLPPGTGDVQISLSQLIELGGAVVVTTPQDVALYDALKSVAMFEKTNTPVLGIVENMSYFICPHCGQRTDIFPRGNIEEECKRRNIRYLGAIPIAPEVSQGSEAGKPIVMSEPNSKAAIAFYEVAKQIAASISVAALSP